MILVAFLVLFSPVVYSYTATMLQPSSLPLGIRSIEWLRGHQDPETGQWLATSPNKQRDPKTEPAKFMSDAATAMAVLSLTFGR